MAGRPDHPSSVTRRVPGTHHDAGWILPTALGLSVMLVPMIVGLRYAGADAPDPDANAANADADGDGRAESGANPGAEVRAETEAEAEVQANAP